MKEKLKSRKLWLAVFGILTGIIMILNDNPTEGTTMVVTSILGYLAAEGYIDAKAVDAALDAAEEFKKED